jgi:hypothetical protein
MSTHGITRAELADLVEQHSSLLVTALRRQVSPTVETLADERPLADAKPSQDELPGRQPPQPVPPGSADGHWSKVGELPGESYVWPGPDGIENYDPFEVWERRTENARTQIGLGRATNRGIYYGKERGYWLAFEMVNGQKRRPIVVFNEADDFDVSGDLVAIIKGKGPGGRSMFAPGDDVPAGYDELDVDVFRDRITGPQAFNRLAVIAKGGDRSAMCTHATLQLTLRF